jgi:hypothetical protein
VRQLISQCVSVGGGTLSEVNCWFLCGKGRRPLKEQEFVNDKSFLKTHILIHVLTTSLCGAHGGCLDRGGTALGGGLMLFSQGWVTSQGFIPLSSLLFVCSSSSVS